MTIGAAGETKQITINSYVHDHTNDNAPKYNLPWTLSSSADWLTVSPSSGDGAYNTTVNVTAAQNNTQSQRTAYLTLTSKNAAGTILKTSEQFAVTQQSGSTTYDVTIDDSTSTTLSFGSDGGEKSCTIKLIKKVGDAESYIHETPSFGEYPAWVTISSYDPNTGSVSIKVGAATASRSDSIKVTWNDVSRYIYISQDVATVVNHRVALSSAYVTPSSARVGDSITLYATFHTYDLYSDGNEKRMNDVTKSYGFTASNSGSVSHTWDNVYGDRSGSASASYTVITKTSTSIEAYNISSSAYPSSFSYGGGTTSITTSYNWRYVYSWSDGSTTYGSGGSSSFTSSESVTSSGYVSVGRYVYHGDYSTYVSDSVYISVDSTPPTYYVSAASGSHFSISGTTSGHPGDPIQFTLTPNTGYSFYDGTSFSSSPSGVTFTLNGQSCSCEVTVGNSDIVIRGSDIIKDSYEITAQYDSITFNNYDHNKNAAIPVSYTLEKNGSTRQYDYSNVSIINNYTWFSVVNNSSNGSVTVSNTQSNSNEGENIGKFTLTYRGSKDEVEVRQKGTAGFYCTVYAGNNLHSPDGENVKTLTTGLYGSTITESIYPTSDYYFATKPTFDNNVTVKSWTADYATISMTLPEQSSVTITCTSGLSVRKSLSDYQVQQKSGTGSLDKTSITLGESVTVSGTYQYRYVYSDGSYGDWTDGSTLSTSVTPSSTGTQTISASVTIPSAPDGFTTKKSVTIGGVSCTISAAPTPQAAYKVYVINDTPYDDLDMPTDGSMDNYIEWDGVDPLDIGISSVNTNCSTLVVSKIGCTLTKTAKPRRLTITLTDPSRNDITVTISAPNM